MGEHKTILPPCQRLIQPSQRGSLRRPLLFLLSKNWSNTVWRNEMPFDPESALREVLSRLSALQMRPGQLAGADDLSRSILSEAATGKNGLTYPIYLKIQKALKGCEAIKARVGDVVPIDWSNSTSIRNLI